MPSNSGSMCDACLTFARGGLRAQQRGTANVP
jgi:hypothetical protein